MNLNTLISQLQLTVICEHEVNKNQEVRGGYTGDLLSDVMGSLDEGMVWMTIQTHRNVVAVATLKEAAAVILVKGLTLEQEALEMAISEELCVYSTPLSAFEFSGKIYDLLTT